MNCIFCNNELFLSSKKEDKIISYCVYCKHNPKYVHTNDILEIISYFIDNGKYKVIIDNLNRKTNIILYNNERVIIRDYEFYFSLRNTPNYVEENLDRFFILR